MKITALTLLGGALGLAMTAPALAEPVVLEATLSGANETDGGDPEGSGSFTGEIDPETGDVCYLLAVADIGDVTAAHIHKGEAGKNGKPVVTIQVTGEVDLCVAEEPEKLQPIVDAPGSYYVNVHTKAFPKGAIRGQLEGEGASADEEVADTAEVTDDMEGEGETAATE